MNAIVTALDAAITNASVPTREPSAVGKLLVLCQTNHECGEWDEEQGCQRMSREEWIRLLITPGERCELPCRDTGQSR